jgi:hypothetical protein
MSWVVTERGQVGQARQGVGDVPVGALVSEVAHDLSTLVRQELELAKAETRQEVVKAGKAGGAFGGAGVAAWIGLVFLSAALMFGLGAVMPLGWAALIVGVLWVIVAAALALYGRGRMRQVSPVPDRTTETIKEDVRWGSESERPTGREYQGTGRPLAGQPVDPDYPTGTDYAACPG